MRSVFAILVSFFTFSALAASTTTYKTTILVGNDVEITLEVYDIATSCQTWGYHYGMRFNIISKSLTNKPYNLTFNAYFFSALGTGSNSYGGAYTISNTNPALTNVTAFNTGKEVNYNNLGGKQNLPENLWCENLTLSDIGLNNIRIDHWGTYGGNTTGNFQSTLPVQLTKFTADPDIYSVKLSWTTASERDNDYFTLERSADGSYFEVIATVKGAGTSSTVNNYLYRDENLPAGTYYYRLKQTDLDGKSELFDIISTVVAERTATEVNIYPNPSSDGYFTIENTEVFSGELVIYNSLGQKVLSQLLNNVFSAKIYLPSENGVYFLEIITDTTSHAVQKKLVLAR
ncbi:MAG: T9SS type A sorting domain-containing protein [Flavobacteriia bacterium]|nr:T9SS type A sorting domain-containing protein [Flavobacteriia bacterium]OJX35220.1 MAG: hypothetical protein BGO87_10030 [Flavobacteriia bacterium 40-80]